jgi:hypothetical protein
MVKKNLKRLIVIFAYISVFTIITDDYLWGIALGTSIGITLSDDDNEKSCCK